MKSCRVCLDLDTTVTHLGNSEAVQHLQEILRNHGLDELKSEHYICFMCKYLLNKYFSFVKRIVRAQEAFRDVKSQTIKNVKFTTLIRSKLNLNLNLSCHSITNFYYGSNIEDHNDIVDISDKEEDNYENDSFSDDPVILNPIDPISTIDNNSENQETENIYEDSDDSKSIMVIKKEKDKAKDKKKEKSSRKKKIKTNVIKPKSKQEDSDGDYNPEYDSASSGSSNEYYNYAGYVGRRDFRVFPLECDECGTVIESKKEHHRHYRIHHQGIEYPYSYKSSFVCQHCGVTRTTIAHLKTHEKIHGEKNVECDECGKKFHSNLFMRRHQVFHRKRAFICDYCNKGFHHRADLTLHIRTHTGEKPFKCHLCDARFAHKGNVGIHIRTRHQQVPRNTSNIVDGKREKRKGGRGEGAKKKTKTNKECAKKKSNIKALRKKSTKEHIKKKLIKRP